MGLEGAVFVVGFFALLFLAVIRHPRYGLYAYMASYYIHPPSRWWGQALPDLRWALLAAAVTLMAVWMKGKQFQSDRVSWSKTVPGRMLMIFTVWLWIQNIWALDPPMQMEISVLYTKYILLFYLIYKLADTPNEVGRILFVHVLGCFYLGYVAHGTYFSGRLEGVGGPDINEANALGMQLATAVMCGAMFILIDRSWRWFVVGAAMPFILNALVLTGSRGAFLSMLVGGMVLTLTKPKKNSKLYYALAAIAVMLFFAVANESFWGRMGTVSAAVDEDKQMDNSAESRFTIAAAQLKMAAVHPFGTGHRGTAVLSPQYLEQKYLPVFPDGTIGTRSSHNTFLSALVEQGILGAVVFAMMLRWCVAACRSLKRRHRGTSPENESYIAAICAALVVFAFAGIFVDYLKNEVQIWLYGLLAALFYTRDSKIGPVPHANG